MKDGRDSDRIVGLIGQSLPILIACRNIVPFGGDFAYAGQTTRRFGLNYKWLVHRDCRAL